MNKLIYNLLTISFFSNICIGQYIKDYTTNVYGRQPFECYRCTNNYDTSYSRSRYDQATADCGFDQDFNPKSSLVKKELCYTYCLKKEVGIVGSRIDVERRCEPTCQEYNGNINSRVKYLIDRISCCVGNACNSIQGLIVNLKLISICVFYFYLLIF